MEPRWGPPYLVSAQGWKRLAFFLLDLLQLLPGEAQAQHHQKRDGGSNWRLPRVREAIAYCKEHGYQGLSASSPSYSLATVTESRWKECIYIDDSEAAQYNDLALPIFSWSSQGAGFFAQIPGGLALPDLNKAYCTDTNFEKLRRATEIAEEKGVSATNIALAYVLNQGYRIAAILGPRTKEEMRDSAAAAEITLTSADVEYLSLRSDKR